jgi:hypothetical protein
MNLLAIRLPLADDRNLLIDDIVGRQRVGGDEQDEEVARAQLLLDLLLPVGPAGHQPVDPEIDRGVLDRWPQITGHERQPLDLALGRMLRLVGVGVADDDERFFGLGRHGRVPSRLTNIRQSSRESRRVSSVLPPKCSCIRCG